MSPRQPMPVGVAGDVSVYDNPRATPRSRYIAKVRIRNVTGKVETLTRTGQTKRQARQRVAVALAESQRRIKSGVIGPDTRVAVLAAEWLAAPHEWSTNTTARYEIVVRKYVVPLFGQLRLREVTPGRIANGIQSARSERADAPSAKTTRSVMIGMFDLAVRHEAVQANPARGAVRITRTTAPKQARALTREQETDLIDKLRSNVVAVEHDFPDLFEWMLGTGCRLGEALAARKATVDLKAGTWLVDATAVRVRGKGVVLQERTKSQAGRRLLALPPQCVDIARRRWSQPHLPWPHDVLFGSPFNPAMCDQSQISRAWRQIRAEVGYPWLSTHAFRKTVLTRLDEAGWTPNEIAAQAGHAKPSITLDTYIDRRSAPRSAADVLDTTQSAQ